MFFIFFTPKGANLQPHKQRDLKMEASRQKDGASRDGTTILYCTPHPKFDCGVLSGQSEG